MVKRMSVATLPKEVLDELHQRLWQSRFGDFAGHAAWLESKGFSISRSAVHRYATGNMTRIKTEHDSDVGISLTEVRLRCLEVAATLNQVANLADLTKRADELLRWVYRDLGRYRQCDPDHA
jgi:SH3-like domain-containing protein